MGSSSNAISGGSSSSADFLQQFQEASQQSINNNLQTSMAQLQLQQQEDQVNTVTQMAGQLEKDNAQNAQKIIGDMT